MITNTTGCTHSTCAKKDRCVRYANYQRQFTESDTLSIINPIHVCQTDDGCEYFLIETKQRFAYGFKALAGSVPKKYYDSLLTASSLGSRSTYYRYYRGEKGLSPTEQQQFLSIIRSLGGNPDIPFDRYEEETVYEAP